MCVLNYSYMVGSKCGLGSGSPGNSGCGFVSPRCSYKPGWTLKFSVPTWSKHPNILLGGNKHVGILLSAQLARQLCRAFFPNSLDVDHFGVCLAYAILGKTCINSMRVENDSLFFFTLLTYSVGVPAQKHLKCVSLLGFW